METRTCTDCLNELPITDFSKDNRGFGDGLRKKCKQCRRIHATDWRQKTGYSNANSAKKWRVNAASCANEKAKQYRLKNAISERDRHKAWRLRNTAKLNARRMHYEARKLSATPAWANRDYIEIWYELARLEQIRTGRKCEVDHIVPLKSPLVCGLHCEFNLQVLFAVDNAAKSNRYWPDMP